MTTRYFYDENDKIVFIEVKKERQYYVVLVDGKEYSHCDDLREVEEEIIEIKKELNLRDIREGK